MKIDERWRALGWRHPLWDYVRFYAGLHKGYNYHKEWLAKLREGVFEIRADSTPAKAKGRRTKAEPDGEAQASTNLVVPSDVMGLFLRYVEERNANYEVAASMLRTKDEALAYCDRLKLDVTTTTTRLEEWQDSPNAMVAAVTNIARAVCEDKGVGFVPKPQKRGVWLLNNDLHVSARNLDGAIPSLFEPKVIWEIKEYWGGGMNKEGKRKDGGSKMSDAVYECNLVGRELREYEEKGHAKIHHVVFLDGKLQWARRDTDLKRFMDLFHQGIIDYLFVGREVETDWPDTLKALLS